MLGIGGVPGDASGEFGGDALREQHARHGAATCAARSELMVRRLTGERLVVDEPDALKTREHVVDLVDLESSSQEATLELPAGARTHRQEPEGPLVAAPRMLGCAGPTPGV